MLHIDGIHVTCEAPDGCRVSFGEPSQVTEENVRSYGNLLKSQCDKQRKLIERDDSAGKAVSFHPAPPMHSTSSLHTLPPLQPPVLAIAGMLVCIQYGWWWRSYSSVESARSFYRWDSHHV